MEWAWQVIIFALRGAFGILAIVISMAIFLCTFALLLTCLYLGIAVGSELYDIYISEHLKKLRERYDNRKRNRNTTMVGRIKGSQGCEPRL